MSESVYRLFDTSGDLLYIGMSSNVERRINQHRHRQCWGSAIAHHTAAAFNTRDEAYIAEQLAIREERPTHNKKFTTDPYRRLDRELKVRIPPTLLALLEADAHLNERTVAASIRYHARRSLETAA